MDLSNTVANASRRRRTLVVLYSPGDAGGSTTRSMVKRRWSSLPRATLSASRRASNLSMLERMSRRSAGRSSTRVFTPAI